ncbi:MAG: hypothetical protein PHD76_01710 [Methylacidiphilales bacterium]|nr:hypothetical protein [Candidatus Methylacidiphilales bacterium]
MTHSDLTPVLDRALEFLRQRQLPSGEFPCAIVSLLNKFPARVDSTPFATTLIASSLAFSDSAISRSMIARACVFLRSQIEPCGVWRYWPRPHPGYKAVRPDVDDTASVSSVLRQNKVGFPNNRGLLLANRSRTGLFYTWIVLRPTLSLNFGYWWVALEKIRRFRSAHKIWQGEPRPDDIDGIVNSNVISYLGTAPYAEPVCAWLIEVFRRQEEVTCDRWYQNRFVFYYSIARNYREGFSAFSVIRKELIERILSYATADGAIGFNAMDTAHSICALLNLEADVPQLDAAVDYLVRAQGPEGGWPYADYYFSGFLRTVAWGSMELTTGFCVQALSRYFKWRR